MKTIATAAFLLTLTALAPSASADNAELSRESVTPASNEPIVLSEAEMDEVTAGTDGYSRTKVVFHWDREGDVSYSKGASVVALQQQLN